MPGNQHIPAASFAQRIRGNGGAQKQRAPRFSGPVSQMKARQRLNGWETAYRDLLEVQKHSGMIRDYFSQAVKLRLADATWFIPDFIVRLNDGRVRVVEIKGWRRDDAIIKWKVCKEMYSAFADEWWMLTKTAEGWVLL